MKGVENRFIAAFMRDDLERLIDNFSMDTNNPTMEIRTMPDWKGNDHFKISKADILTCVSTSFGIDSYRDSKVDQFSTYIAEGTSLDLIRRNQVLTINFHLSTNMSMFNDGTEYKIRSVSNWFF